MSAIPYSVSRLLMRAVVRVRRGLLMRGIAVVGIVWILGVAAAMLVIVLIGKISGLVDLFTLVLGLFTLLVGLLYPLFYGLVCAAFYEEISGSAANEESKE